MRKMMSAVLGLALTLAGASAPAQVRTIDPNRAIDNDLDVSRRQPPERIERPPVYPDEPVPSEPDAPPPPPPPVSRPNTAPDREAQAEATTNAADTFERDDLISAGEGVFGKGAAGFRLDHREDSSEPGPPECVYRGARGFGRVRRRATLRLGYHDA